LVRSVSSWSRALSDAMRSISVCAVCLDWLLGGAYPRTPSPSHGFPVARVPHRQSRRSVAARRKSRRRCCFPSRRTNTSAFFHLGAVVGWGRRPPQLSVLQSRSRSASDRPEYVQVLSLRANEAPFAAREFPQADSPPRCYVRDEHCVIAHRRGEVHGEAGESGS
jgi:hypothetical protein